MIIKTPEVSELTFAAPSVQSLVWQADTLIDWTTGAHYHLDGSTQGRSFHLAHPFDAAVALPDGGYSVVYTRLGTKGLVLRDGKIIREINRSFYWANAYEYPIALTRLTNGRAVIAHCPEHYNQLEIDDAETGERLTPSATRKPDDIFHSRLSISTDGRFLLDAAWHWHPVDGVRLFDLEDALKDPGHLDTDELLPSLYADKSAAAFDAHGNVLVSLDGDIDEERPLQEIQTYKPGVKTPRRTTVLSQPLGTLMPVGEHFVLGLYEHPRLIDLRNGSVLQAWPHINSGKQTSSILRGIEAPPVMAFDPVGQRWAVVNDDKLIVLAFDA